MLAGQAAGAAVAQNSGPAFGFRSDAGGDAFPTLSEPSLEEGFLVVQEDSHLLKDRDDVANPQVEGTERAEYLAVADDVALGVSGEHDGQAAVDSEADAASPAPGFGELVGEVLRPGQPGAGQVGGGRVEPTVVTRNLLEQRQLPPTGSRP
ncbi:hypothetical protein [Streptomyces griseoruber]|uniref:Uncharacterized protein n=1 Tax=Streptomyces griseoruber TaxID=1943 RepID=A0A101SMI9_9ACTN|nr:hypothetical protein [Streptomyces griseoruber]KUN76594.1 hypothetical protein AQJ64_37130 [Streptomyces griseoruber]